MEKGNDSNVQVQFEWSTQNISNTLNVHHGITTRVLGTRQEHVAYNWKTPGCPFFIRYQPQNYQFALLLNATELIRIPLDFSLINISGLQCQNKINHHHHHSAQSNKTKHH
ncbi:uncharacterized protein BX664DRAFT_346522 [Halteromyces radiatus]|uniref:uncharacterized protein n=1 Tax=Halteromyces radiatus TaxID=101107 RepID=UPI0022203163|nr:uncharacterized protein BX664DRAFT_346522 [Halteromyces radiatus]KAI8096457.1 hypothetical protein BX664DRAFT_346522 [Halteromyces radiatus]